MLRLTFVLVTMVAGLAQAAPATLRQGGLTLQLCDTANEGYCGRIDRPIDPAGHVPGTVPIVFMWYPRHDRAAPSAGVIAAQEGGPGYSTIGSANGYVPLFAPLRDHRDLLLMDKRGTGGSGAIDCPSLQKAASPSIDDYAACGRRLGARAWFYRTALAADDLAALLDALAVRRIDLYGDSYGTYFGQVFAALHGDRLRTLVLDSAYPVRGQTPWFQTEYQEWPRALRAECARSPACARLGGDPVARFAKLIEALRAHPLTGVAPSGDGTLLRVRADPPTLFTLVDFAGNSPVAYRDLDAAGRAFLDHGDERPLLRLVAEGAVDQLSGDLTPDAYSVGLFAAVTCTDYVQPFDLRADVDTRAAQAASAIAREAAITPPVYAPFRLTDILAAPYQPVAPLACLGWPAPPPGVVPGRPIPPHAKLPDIPVLVINGGIDTITSPTEGREVAAQFPSATFVLVANAVHEAAIGDGGVLVPPYGYDLAQCGGPIVERFVASGGDPGDTSCRLRARPIRLVPAFARRAKDVAPATPGPTNTADDAALRIASAAAETVGDVVAGQYYAATSGTGAGLRGGRFDATTTDRGYAFTLRKLRWTEDLTVSGTIDWDQLSGVVIARVTLRGVADGDLTVTWNDRVTNATAALTGTIGPMRVAATRVAP